MPPSRAALARARLPTRFAVKTVVGPKPPKHPELGNCLIWTASKNRKGYGQYRDGKLYIAHRYAHALLVGPIPEGYQIHHTCEVVACVLHTEALTVAEHNKHTDPGAFHRNKTIARCGHPYSLENTLRDRKGERRCRTCNIARGRLRHLKAREARKNELG